MKLVNCYECGKQFSHTSSMYCHLRTAHNVSKHLCSICNMQINQKDNYPRHHKNHHTNSTSEDFQFKFQQLNPPKRTLENNHIGRRGNTNETGECITEEETINGNLNVYHFPALDNTKFDHKECLAKMTKHKMVSNHARSFYQGKERCN